MRPSKICQILSLVAFLSFSALDSKYLTRFISVYAQEWLEEARVHYEKGSEFYQQQNYKESEEEFQKAYALISREQNSSNGKNSELAETAEQEEIQENKVLQYTIGAGDTLKISVWEWDNLNQEVIVRPDGMISYPLVGEVPAEGLTLPQLTAELTKRLKEYIKSPQVSISVTKIGGRKIIVLGEVAQPGVYSVTGNRTVLEAIALAQGFSKDAVLSSVIVIKGGFQNPKGRRLDLNRAISKADMSQNIALEPEDIVYVPKKFIANVNYFVTTVLGTMLKGVETAESLQKRRFLGQ